MAERSALQRAPGLGADRIQPTGWIPPDGDWVWCFGNDVPRWTAFFNDEDEARVENPGTIAAGTKLLRARAFLRGALAALPTGWSWRGFVEINGTKTFDVELETNKGREINDLIIPVRDYTGSIIAGLQVVGPVDGAEVEIPAFYIDHFLMDDAPALLELGNRIPVPAETGVLRDSAIHFDLVPTDVDDVDLNATTITVEGVTAYSGGAQQNGWTVNVVADAVAGIWHFELLAPADFPSLEVVTVRAQSANLMASAFVDSTWSFTVEDYTPPVVVSAVATGHRTVRVTFDEPVLMVNASGSADALNVANWSIEPPVLPEIGVEVVVVSVAAVDPYSVELTVDIPFTRNVTYRVVASDIEDLFGNAVAAPDDDATFAGWACAFPEDRDFSIWFMYPARARERDTTGDLLRWATILQEVTDVLLCDVDGWTDVLDVDLAPEWAVEHMLLELGNPFRFDLTLDEKRKLVRVLVAIYRQKGTAVGLINVVRLFLGLEVTVEAWAAIGWILGEDELGEDTVLGPGTAREKYTFDVVAGELLTDEQRDAIRALVDYMKPAHEHLGSIREPEEPTVIDHLELGLSELGVDWLLH